MRGCNSLPCNHQGIKTVGGQRKSISRRCENALPTESCRVLRDALGSCSYARKETRKSIPTAELGVERKDDPRGIEKVRSGLRELSRDPDSHTRPTRRRVTAFQAGRQGSTPCGRSRFIGSLVQWQNGGLQSRASGVRSLHESPSAVPASGKARTASGAPPVPAPGLCQGKSGLLCSSFRLRRAKLPRTRHVRFPSLNFSPRKGTKWLLVEVTSSART